MCQTPLCQNLNEGDGAALGVTATGLCLQMELLAQPSASGRGLGCQTPKIIIFSFLRALWLCQTPRGKEDGA